MPGSQGLRGTDALMGAAESWSAPGDAPGLEVLTKARDGDPFGTVRVGRGPARPEETFLQAYLASFGKQFCPKCNSVQ